MLESKKKLATMLGAAIMYKSSIAQTHRCTNDTAYQKYRY